MTGILDLELSEHHVRSLVDLLRVHGEADLCGVFGDESLTILSQLLEGLALALGALTSAASAGSLLNEGLEAELDRDSHQVRVLCDGRVSLHHISQLKLLLLSEQNAPSVFNPNHLLLRLLVHFDESAASDKQFILQSVFQIANFLTLICQHGIRRVEKAGKVWHEGQEKDCVPVVLLLPLKLSTRDNTLDYVLRVSVEVGAHVEKTGHDFLVFVELERDALEV